MRRLTRSFSIMAVALTGSLALAIPASAQTDLQWDNGLPGWAGRININTFVIAGDFVVEPDRRLDVLRFWTLEYGAATTFYWALYADNGTGIPGTQIAYNVIAPSLRTALGTVTFHAGTTNEKEYDKWENEIQLGGLTLPAGRFWIALHNGPLDYTTGDVHLVNTGSNAANGAYAVRGDSYAKGGFDGNFTDYSPSSEEFAFQVYGETVPEPITMILLGTGLLGVGGVAARRRRETGELD